MSNVSEYSDCYGCGVCAAACPKNVIKMNLSGDGFYKPKIVGQCIGCGICMDVCSFALNKEIECNDIPIKAFAAWSYCANVRQKCTSGGISYELGKYMISNGYIVVPVRYSFENQRAEHYIAKNEEELDQSIGSKYIQSDTFEAFSRIEKGNKYFIIGTPCQIASVRLWMEKRKMDKDVLLLDFFCHGVPSYLMWEKYLQFVRNKIGAFDEISWRSKLGGWQNSTVMTVGEKYRSFYKDGDLFYKFFLGDRCLGKACYDDCKFKYTQSRADIRLGDLWGRDYSENEKGVNGVLCLTKKGQDVLQGISNSAYLKETTVDVVGGIQMRICAKRPTSYRFVSWALKTPMSLKSIDIVASIIELRLFRKIIYLFKRMTTKISDLIKNSSDALL